MASVQQPLVTPDSFKGEFTTTKLLNRLSERILDQHEARVANSNARTKQQQILPYDSLVSMDQLVMQFDRADKELQALRSELDAKVDALSAEVGDAEELFQDMCQDLEENVVALVEGFNDLEQRMNNITSVATKFGDRLQNIDTYRKNAAEAVRIIQALQEFSNVEDLKELSEMYQDESRLEEAAALTRRGLELAVEVTRANERISASAQASTSLGSTKRDLTEKGTIERARERLEEFRNRLQQRVVHRFDKGEARRDLADMAACARIMQEFEGSSSSPSLVQRYISTRSMFTDPKELALGHSEPVVDTNTALAAKRRLGTLYKSVTAAVRHESAIMDAVFARPKEALSALVQRLFEQRIQTVLGNMLALPPPDAKKEMLEAFLKLLGEAYQSTCALARTLQESVGPSADVMALVELAFSEVLEQYPELELRLLRLQYHSSPYMGPRGVLLQDPVVQWFKWNQDALDRATILCTDAVQRAEAVRRTIHNSSSKQADVGCLLEQVAIHLTTGLDGALLNCRQRRWPAYGSASLANMQRATVRQAALKVAQQGIGQVLGAISQASAIIKMLQAHYAGKVAGLLEPAPHVAQACSRGFAAMLRATEDHIMAILEAAVADVFDVVGAVWVAEQKRQDFRPAEELPASLDQPTEACALVSALLAAILQEGSQTLQASNLLSFNAQIGMRALKALDAHMERFTFSPAGALRWKRDVTEYSDALAAAVAGSPAVRAKLEELTGGASVLVVAPESLLLLVENSLRWPRSQALRFVRQRHDFKTAKVRGKSLAALFADG